ncbi:MAG: GNAT family N-acetyltransferase [Candidatus Sumerlaeaceae bacterium]|nr:GNAT family N-acetyltransferase [Candidatus Sumerlaeaceae bacterium]
MSERLTIRTERLELVAGDLRILEMAVENRRQLAAELNAAVPRSWPPPVMLDTLDMHMVLLQNDPSLAHGWLSWIVIVRDADGGRTVAGIVCFAGRPDSTGTVRLGFALIPEFEGLGYVTEAAQALVNWVFRQPGVKRVMAQAFAQHIAYIRVLERLGMTPGEAGTHPGTTTYYLEKDAVRHTPVA